MAGMVKAFGTSTATFFYVTDVRSLDRTLAPQPHSGAVDSSGQARWWYVPQAPSPQPSR